MTWIPDLTPLSYFGDEAAGALRAVGWLERGQHYARGPVEKSVYDKLVELAKDPFQPIVAAGFHQCDLCQFDAERVGASNLFIPGEKLIFVCPELVVHYVNAHEYRPPDEFCTAVLECPNTRSMEYKKRFLASGGRTLLRHAG